MVGENETRNELIMKGLDKYEKLKEFQSYRFLRCERHTAAIYLHAIWKDDKEVMDSFERFGTDLHHILLNYRQNEMNIKYGFGELELCKYAWVPFGKLKPGKIIQIDRFNYITSGMSPSGHWFHGESMETSTSGRHSGASIWGKPYQSEKDALIAGLNNMVAWYEKQLEGLKHETDSVYDEDDEDGCKTPKVSAKEEFCKKIIKLAKKAISEVKEPQLELF
jgi:hypothetical protein